MKSIAEYYVSCDLIGCNQDHNYFAGEEEKITKIGWVFIYPKNSKNEFECWTLCPKHSHLAHFFKGVPYIAYTK